MLEADQLGNKEFFQWYATNVFFSEALTRLMEIKMECRSRGFDIDVDNAQSLALHYMRGLKLHLIDAHSRSVALTGPGGAPS